jgi:hypothetical protein
MSFRFWRRKSDEELEEEIQSHLRMPAGDAAFIWGGASPARTKDECMRPL